MTRSPIELSWTANNTGVHFNCVFNKPGGFHGGSIYRASSYQDLKSSAVACPQALEVLSVIVLDVLKEITCKFGLLTNQYHLRPESQRAIFLVKYYLFFERRECTCHMRGKKFCQLVPPGEREENILVKTAENISATRHHPWRGLRQLRRRSTLLATVTQVVWSRDTVWSWIVQLPPDHKLIELIKLLRGNSSEEIAARIPRQTFPKEKWGTRPCDHLFL